MSSPATRIRKISVCSQKFEEIARIAAKSFINRHRSKWICLDTPFDAGLPPLSVAVGLESHPFLPFSLLFFISLSLYLPLFFLSLSPIARPFVFLTPFASTPQLLAIVVTLYSVPLPSGKNKGSEGWMHEEGSTLHSQITIGRHRWNINMDTGLGGWLPQPAVVAGQLACQLACCPVL